MVKSSCSLKTLTLKVQMHKKHFTHLENPMCWVFLNHLDCHILPCLIGLQAMPFLLPVSLFISSQSVGGDRHAVLFSFWIHGALSWQETCSVYGCIGRSC